MVASSAFLASFFLGLAAAIPSNTKRAVQAGSLITSCTKAGTVALTFDDGPYDFTQTLVNTLAAKGHKATFFQNGNNWGKIGDYATVLQNQIAAGHLLCSHTWTHADLTAITETAANSEMSQVEVAFKSIIGKIPTCMRPPYLAYNDTTLAYLGKIGYKVFSIDIDTLDWEYDDQDYNIPITNYKNGFNAGGRLSLNHDVYQITVDQVVPPILTFLEGKGLKSVTVAECLGEDPNSWYVQSTYLNPNGGSSSSSSSSSTRTSTSTRTSSSTSTSSTSSTSTRTTSSTASTSSTSTRSTSSTATASSTSTRSTSTSTSTRTSSTSTRSTSTSTSTRTSSAATSTQTSGTSTRAASTTTSSRATTPTGTVSQDGSCGGAKGYICGAGECCSGYGWCGTSASYCGTGCNPTFGTCSGTGTGTGTGGSGTVDPNGTCGGSTGFVCASGMCCSKYGYCGTGKAYCG